MKPERQKVVNPDLCVLMDAQKELTFRQTNCHKVGRIVSFNSENQTAQAELMITRETEGKVIEYPILVDCPVIFLSGGDSRITMPIKEGDSCLILFNDEDIDNWFTSGNKLSPNTNRMHSLTDGFILVGMRNNANKVSNYLTNAINLRYNNSDISIYSDHIEITDGSCTITMSGGNITLEGSAININGNLSINGTPYLSHIHSGVTSGSGSTGGVAN